MLQYHKKKMNYWNEIDKILKRELTILINKVRNKEYPFNKEVINQYQEKYRQVKKEKIKI